MTVLIRTPAAAVKLPGSAVLHTQSKYSCLSATDAALYTFGQLRIVSVW